ncbi:6-phosphofructokinase [Breznakia sp. PF5-3]|uniref:diphosphate--fructose-6-phosphate 1-phosphotransferase n=1 Tax=unclassified Breznakia TaxID=2623764 RepID=UPI002404BB30|nr:MULTISPECIES: diphosphate--fructose-6-phosphate 1-phosphotransferase [unclassified Breznakia]MDL2276402.1 diphosphate--fructose-6-phosphate 1-phosphotransferase [Breznakia sp. OttesenSCG-928-G09]MDF9823788.1 6-phosphofructokinase [Breznakia sp. PM6-1]MDF9834646.1 6-phosphofructokinase [Breznakia sp. PF5-3]MDF9836737.1 6-phosphofructokinase [Breznakia sp. PFB2-8]MDF9858814.1 6-phosphofructokinase [Breznakia sp. PH5-24]
MANCLVAQSGGPTTVINASLAGVVKANQLNPIYDTVYGGLNGIEGILEGRLYDLTNMSELENRILKQTPSSALGSCRYKLKRDDDTDYRRLVDIMDQFDIEILFYIGGNDSMDTVDALSQWAKQNGINKRFVGIPKTVDNDLMVTDHCPGFASAAKFVNAVVTSTWLDYNVYTRAEVFILETMGRDAGWLAASSVISNKVDLLVLPEEDFDKDNFLKQVKNCMDTKGKCYIVVSEGAHFADGSYLAAAEAKNDGFGHAVLGGAGNALKNMILDAGIAPRAKVQDLSTAQRCANYLQSYVDVEEAFKLGMSGHMRSADKDFTGQVVGVVRKEGAEYDVDYIAGPANEFANHVKNIPAEWILPDYQGLVKEAYDYFMPLIQGEPDLIMENGVPAYVKPYHMR